MAVHVNTTTVWMGMWMLSNVVKQSEWSIRLEKRYINVAHLAQHIAYPPCRYQLQKHQAMESGSVRGQVTSVRYSIKVNYVWIWPRYECWIRSDQCPVSTDRQVQVSEVIKNIGREKMRRTSLFTTPLPPLWDSTINHPFYSNSHSMKPFNTCGEKTFNFEIFIYYYSRASRHRHSCVLLVAELLLE